MRSLHADVFDIPEDFATSGTDDSDDECPDEDDRRIRWRRAWHKAHNLGFMERMNKDTAAVKKLLDVMKLDEIAKSTSKAGVCDRIMHCIAL